MTLPEENLYKYKNEEHIVGVEEDGTLVYEKRLIGIVNTDTTRLKTIILKDNTIKDLIDCEGWIYSDDVNKHKLNGYANSSAYSLFQWNSSIKELSIWNPLTYNGHQYDITIRYTKN